MLRRFLHAAVCAGVSIGALVWPATGHAQTAAPSQLTPQSLRPAAPPNEQTVVVPGPSAIATPGGDSHLTVLVGDVELEGGFPELFAANEALVAKLRNHPLSVAQIYAAASELERAYTEAGYV